MAASKTTRKTKNRSSKKKPTPNKSAFVRSLPATMPGAEVVAKAKAQGINISLAYVYGIRAKSKAKTRKGGTVATRGPGRPRKDAAAPAMRGGNGASAAVHRASGGLEAEIERIVEAKVSELLKARLGALFK
jgi:post-segregation antitoxin (ccd killing protein)